MELARKFFRWWFDELAGLVPASLRQKMSGYRVLIVLTIRGNVGHLTLERGSQSTPLMSFDLDDASIDAVRGDLKARLGSVRRKYFGRQAVLQLQLPAACALTNTIALPRAAEENLHEVIVFELDRYTPFTAVEAYCAYQKLAQRADAAQLKVLVSVVQRSVADATLAKARELGFEPDRIVVDTGKDAPAALDLLMEDTAERSYDLLRPLRFALVGTAAGLVITAAVLPLWHVRAALDSDQRRLAEVKRHADEAARLQREIDALQADASVLVQRKRQLLPATQLLAELTHLLPDDTWLLELQTTGGDVQFQGFSVSASSLIALLEGSKVLRKATFRSPITPDPVTSRERFQISAQMVQAGDQ